MKNIYSTAVALIGILLLFQIGFIQAQEFETHF